MFKMMYDRSSMLRKRIVAYAVIFSVIISMLLVYSGDVKAEKCEDNGDYVIFSRNAASVMSENKCINGKIATGNVDLVSVQQEVIKTLKKDGEDCYSDTKIKLDKLNQNHLGCISDISIDDDCINESNAIYYSKTGDIIIRAKNINIDGLIYAPKGRVYLEGDYINFKGVIISQDVKLNATHNININKDCAVSNFVKDNKDVSTLNDDIYTYKYDEFGNRISISIGNKELVRYKYENSFSSILLREDYSNGTSYSYDNQEDSEKDASMLKKDGDSSFVNQPSEKQMNYTCRTKGSTYKEKYCLDSEENIREVKSDEGNIKFDYDKNHRVRSIENGEKLLKYTYDYDERSNLKRKVVYNIKTGTNDLVEYKYDNDWKDQLVSFGNNKISYDNYGNITSFLDYSMKWEKGNQLKSINKGENLFEYNYDKYGLRTSKKINGATTTFSYNDDKIVEQKQNDHEIKFVYDNYDRVTALIYDGKKYSFILSGQGDVKEIVDEKGTSVVKYEYDPYGKVDSISGAFAKTLGKENPIRFRGYYYDEETQLYYLKSRYYSPELQRFICPDNPAYVDVSKNLYSYCEGDPVNSIDENGHLSWRGGNPVINRGSDYQEYKALLDKEYKLLITVGIKYHINATECLYARQKYNITTNKRLAHFWAQAYVETDGGWKLTERGGKEHFKHTAYGMKYRGAGFLQLTWKDNYKAFSKAQGDSKIYSKGADYVAKNYPWISAGFFWNYMSFNKLADKGNNVHAITRILNGKKCFQQARRQKTYDRIKKLL